LKNNKIKKSALFPLIFLVAIVSVFIQAIQPQDKKKKQRVDIDNADLMVHDEKISANTNRLLGHVSFRRDGALMFCDSAYMYTDSKKFDTYGNVHIIQGDSLHLYGDKMFYDGDTKLANFVGNVKLIDKSITLTTEALDFDLATNIGYYTNRGKIIDTANVLTSVIGRYYSNLNMFFFKDSVVVTNKDFILRADTLKYNSQTERAFIVGPTTITGTEKDGVLYSERGWYDTRKNIAELYKASKITNKSQVLEADTLFYDRASGNGRGKHRVTLSDTTNKVVIKGKIGVYNEITKIGYVTDSAMFIQYGKKDTMYMHADTLLTKPDTIQTKPDIIKHKPVTTLNKIIPHKSDTILTKNDSLQFKADSLRVKPDSLQVKVDTPQIKADLLPVKDVTPVIKSNDDKFFMAYRHVRFHKIDLQGQCDSLGYRMKDSTLLMFYDPVLWSQQDQMTAEKIQFISKNPDPDIARLENNAFLVMSEDSVKFDQISGKIIIGQIFDNKLRIADVNGNAQSLYYLKDKNRYSGMNRLISSKIKLHLTENQIDSIRFYPKPEGKTIPIKELQPDDIHLDGFVWRESERPINQFDLYPIDEKRKKNAGPEKKPASKQ
jgi:lipopolysaccharide export system protein LptA